MKLTSVGPRQHTLEPTAPHCSPLQALQPITDHKET